MLLMRNAYDCLGDAPAKKPVPLHERDVDGLVGHSLGVVDDLLGIGHDVVAAHIDDAPLQAVEAVGGLRAPAPGLLGRCRDFPLVSQPSPPRRSSRAGTRGWAWG